MVVIIRTFRPDLPRNPLRQVFSGLEVQPEILGRGRLLPQGANDERWGLIQWDGTAVNGGRRSCLACQRLLEDGDCPGVEGDEQCHAGDYAGPGVHGFVDADKLGAHGEALNVR